MSGKKKFYIFRVPRVIDYHAIVEAESEEEAYEKANARDFYDYEEADGRDHEAYDDWFYSGDVELYQVVDEDGKEAPE